MATVKLERDGRVYEIETTDEVAAGLANPTGTPENVEEFKNAMIDHEIMRRNLDGFLQEAQQELSPEVE